MRWLLIAVRPLIWPLFFLATRQCGGKYAKQDNAVKGWSVLSALQETYRDQPARTLKEFREKVWPGHICGTATIFEKSVPQMRVTLREQR